MAILRGGVNKRGVSQPNYHYEDIQRLLEMYAKMGLQNPGGYCGRKPLQLR